jgi:hypothetical protein
MVAGGHKCPPYATKKTPSGTGRREATRSAAPHEKAGFTPAFFIWPGHFKNAQRF